MPFPSTLKVDDLNTRHPDCAKHSAAWEKIAILYEGAECFREHASKFLTRRPREPFEVWEARLHHASFTNHLGAICTWYESALFASEPDVDRLDASDATLPEDSPVSQFYAGFLANCDRAGTKFSDHYRRIFADLILYGRAYSLLDLPPPGAYQTLAEQQASGGLQPFLLRFDPRTVINWSDDAYGNLAWCTIATETQEHSATFPFALENVMRWYHYNATEYAVYEARWADDEEKPKIAALQREGKHALTELDIVPVFRFQLPDGYWIAKRMYLPMLKYVDTENALDWALLMSALALLYIKGQVSDPERSETAWLQLPADGEAGYIEPSGTSFGVMKERLEQLREEIYRLCYLIQQGRSSEATPAAQSGISKEADMMPSYEVLAAFGDNLRAAMTLVLTRVAALMKHDVRFSVRGFDFDDTDADARLSLIERVQAMQIPSDRLDRELAVMVVDLILSDHPDEVKRAVVEEILAAPTREERIQQDLEMRAQVAANAINATAA